VSCTNACLCHVQLLVCVSCTYACLCHVQMLVCVMYSSAKAS